MKRVKAIYFYTYFLNKEMAFVDVLLRFIIFKLLKYASSFFLKHLSNIPGNQALERHPATLLKSNFFKFFKTVFLKSTCQLEKKYPEKNVQKKMKKKLQAKGV